MARRTIMLMGYLLSSCSYDGSRLVPPAVSHGAPDASSADTSADRRDRSDGTVDAGSDAGRDAGRDGGSAGAGKGDAAVLGDCESDPAEGKTLAVAFSQGRAQGAMSGYGYVSLGALDTVTSPTCGGMPIGSLAPSDPPVTLSSTCWPSAITWGSPSALCVTGEIPGWSSSPSYLDYVINWGILVGAATRDPAQAIGVAYRTITVTVTGWESGRLLAVVHLADDPSNLVYCAEMTSGVPVRLSSFNTECFFGSGTDLAAADVSRIDKVGVQVPSRRAPVTLSNFCLSKLEFGR